MVTEHTVTEHTVTAPARPGPPPRTDPARPRPAAPPDPSARPGPGLPSGPGLASGPSRPPDSGLPPDLCLPPEPSRPDRAPRSSGPARRPLVAVVCPYFTPVVGGLERYAERVARAVADSDDLDVVVITSGPGRRAAAPDHGLGYPVIRLGTWATLSRTPVNPLWFPQVRRILGARRVDLVHAHAPVPMMAEAAVWAAGRRPVVLTYHSGSMVKGDYPLDPLIARYERTVLPRLFDRADSLVAVSPMSLAVSVPTASMIMPGVDPVAFAPPPRPSYDTPTVLYVGSVDESTRWKGLDTLIDAVAIARGRGLGASLDVVGPGNAVESHRARARGAGIAGAVRFHGVRHGPELLALYQRAGVVVLPSRSPAESFGMVLAEAMACARPVIGSRCGGIPYVLDDGVDGLLVPPGDPAALAGALTTVLTDPGLAARFGANGRRKAERSLSWDGRMRSYLEIYRGLLARGRAR